MAEGQGERPQNIPQGEHPGGAPIIRKSLFRAFLGRARQAKEAHAEGADAGFRVPDAEKGIVHEVPYQVATFSRQGDNEYSIAFPQTVEEDGGHGVRNVVIGLSFAALVGMGIYVRHQHHKK